MRIFPIESAPFRAPVMIYLLCAPRLEHAGRLAARNITIEKAAALLAYLAASSVPVTREHLQTLLWPESHAHAGRKNLRNLLWQISSQYADDLLATDHIYISLSSAVWTDVGEFECVAAHKEANLKQVRDIHFRLRGISLLPDFRARAMPQFELWLTLQRERLGRLYDDMSARLIAHYRDTQDWQQVIEVAYRAIAADRRQERIYFHLIDAYRRMGERTNALHAYEQMRTWLATEYGLQPTDEMRQLQRLILTDNLTQSSHRFRKHDEIISTGFSSHTYLQHLIEDAPKDTPEDTSA